jgi:hypothetical protein
MESEKKLWSFDNEMELEEKSEELVKIYEKAAQEGIWLREFKSGKGYFAIAGSEKLDEKMGREKIDIEQAPMHVCMERGIFVHGKTREEACESAMKGLKRNYPSLNE